MRAPLETGSSRESRQRGQACRVRIPSRPARPPSARVADGNETYFSVQAFAHRVPGISSSYVWICWNPGMGGLSHWEGSPLLNGFQRIGFQSVFKKESKQILYRTWLITVLTVTIFIKLRRYHTRPLRLSWGLKNVHFGKTHFRDPNINVRIFFLIKEIPGATLLCFAFSTTVPNNTNNSGTLNYHRHCH